MASSFNSIISMHVTIHKRYVKNWGPRTALPSTHVMNTLTTFTCAFVNISKPDICLIFESLASSGLRDKTTFLSTSYKVICIVPPKTESINEPSIPHDDENKIMDIGLTSRPLSISKIIAPTPTNAPPTQLMDVPRTVAPPLVPAGTVLQFHKKIGCDFDSIPISEAIVSPRHVA